MTGLEIGFLTLAGMMLLVWCGLHVAVALGLTSFVGVWLLKGDLGVATSMLAQGASDSIASHIFGVVPLFVLMGFLVSIADIGKDAFEVANQGLRRLRGGLGIATVAANAVFAAITGKTEPLLPNATTAHCGPPLYRGIESSTNPYVYNYPRTGRIAHSIATVVRSPEAEVVCRFDVGEGL